MLLIAADRSTEGISMMIEAELWRAS